MIRLRAAALIFFPAGVSACDSMAALPAAAGACGGGHGCGALAVALMAAVAALGSWVLRSAEKDSGASRRAGQAVGWTLVVVGLLGFLCGAVSHAARGWSRGCRARAGTPETKLPPGHPPIGPLEK